MTTLQVAYPHGIDAARMEDMSVPVFLASLHERDWVLRQLVVYEHGGLTELVEKLASPRLLERADHVARWPHTPMGGYRLESDINGQLQVTDLGDETRLDVLDLGLAAHHEPGACLLGRLAPTAAQPGRMFEWRPLPVDEGTARMVADRPEAWLSIVATRAHEKVLPSMFSYLDDSSLMADLPFRSWLGLLERDEVDDLPVTDGLIDCRDVALVVLGKLLTAAKGVPLGLGVARHYAESLLLEPGVDDGIATMYGGREFARAWWVMSRIVREPARGRCLRLAEMSASA